jgi:hypothetical protein
MEGIDDRLTRRLDHAHHRKYSKKDRDWQSFMVYFFVVILFIYRDFLVDFLDNH